MKLTLSSWTAKQFKANQLALPDEKIKIHAAHLRLSSTLIDLLIGRFMLFSSK